MRNFIECNKNMKNSWSLINLRSNQASMHLFPVIMTQCDKYIRDLKSTSIGDKNIITFGVFKLASPYF